MIGPAVLNSPPTEATHELTLTIDGKRIAGVVKEVAAKRITHDEGDMVLRIFGEELRDALTATLRLFVARHFDVRNEHK